MDREREREREGEGKVILNIYLNHQIRIIVTEAENNMGCKHFDNKVILSSRT